MKNKLTLILALLALLVMMALPMLSAQAESTSTVLSGSGWSYDNGVLTITANLPNYHLASSKSDWFIGTPFEKAGIDHTTTTIIIQEGVTSIGNLAFYGFNKLTKVTFPSTLTTIGSDTFRNCGALTEITIPASVTSMGNDAFGLSHLTKITFEGKPPSLGTWSGYYDGIATIKAFSGASGQVYYPPYNAWTGSAIANYSGNAYLTWNPVYSSKGTAGPNATWYLLYDGTLVISGTGDLSGYTRANAPWRGQLDYIKDYDVASGITFNYTAGNTPMINTGMESIAMGLGGTMDLSGQIAVDASFLMKNDYTLAVADETVATLNGHVLTAVGYGSTELIVEAVGYPELSITIPVLVANEVTSITLPSRLYAGVGVSIPLEATVTPSEGAGELTWTLGNSSIGVIEDGVLTVTATAASSTTVTATSWNGVTASTTLHIYVPTVSKVTLNEIPAYCGVGDSLQLIATVRDNIRTYENQLVSFTSSDPSIAKVDEKGLVQFLTAGTVSFTAQSANGKSSTVTTEVLHHTESIETAALPELFVGETAQATITAALPGTASDYISWTTMDSRVATVDESGLVTAVGAGSTQIAAVTWDGVIAAADITVHGPITAVSIDAPEQPYYILDAIQLTARVQCEAEFVNRFVTWESSDPDIVSVDENGLANLNSYGAATITATTINGLKAEITITIRMEIWDFALAQGGELYAGGTCPMQIVNLDPEDADLGITWVSHDTSIVTVDENGVLTGVAEGMADVTATAWNGLSRTLTIIVNPPCEHPDIVTDEAVAPTDYATGLTEGSHCDVCGKVIVAQEVIPANFTVVDGVLKGYNGGKTEVVIPADLGITKIGSAFFFNEELTSLVIPEGVTEIGHNAFANCWALESVHLPSTMRTIDGDAFLGCFRLSFINLPEGLTSLGSGCFYDCDALVSITLPKSLTSIGEECFHNCFSLTTITLPNGLQTIGDNVFYGCNSLSAINLGCSSSVKDELIAQGHEAKLVTTHNEQPLPAVDATCTTEGLTEGSACADCGEVFTAQEVVPATGHTPVTDEAVAPTDYATGLTEGSHCDVCGEVFVAQEVIPAIFTVEDGVLVAYNGTATEVVIPADLGIAKIGSMAFASNKAITSMVIPEGVTEIQEYAFQSLRSLSSVTLPGSLISIGKSAFVDCAALTGIVIPEGVTSIGQAAFYDCSALASVTLPDSLTSLSAQAFAYCSKLKSIELPDGLTMIDAYAFYQCQALTSVTLPDQLAGIGESAFHGCSQLTGIALHDGLTSIGNAAFSDCSQLTEIVLPDTLTTLGDGAFCRCSNLTSIKLSNQLTAIGKETFLNCGALTSLSIPDSVTSIGSHALTGCTALTCISLDCASAVKEELIAQGHESKLSIIHDVQPLPAFDATCTTDGMTEGSHCEVCGEILVAQETITAPGHTEVIDEAVDATCTTDGLTEGSHCEVCGEILVAQEVIPAAGHTEVIDEGYAPTCTEDGLTEGKHCEVCGEIIVAQEVDPATGHNPVVDEAVLPTATTPGLTEGSHCDNCGLVFVAQEVIPAGFIIENGVLTGCNLDDAEIVIPEGLGITRIGSYAFLDNDVLTSIVIPEGVTEIGDHAFMYCYELEAISLPSTLTKIEDCAFNICESLTEISLPESVSVIGESAFYHCSKLKEIVIPEGVTEIGGHTFQYCYNLNFVQLPSTVQSIGEYAFEGCAITEMTIPEGVTRIEEYTFNNCSALEKVTLPSTLQRIGRYAFASCNITEIAIPDSVTSIHETTFNCISEQLTIVSSWDAYARTWAEENGVAWRHDVHTEVIDAAVDVTCTTDGLTEGKHCEVCGEIIVAQEVIPATGHNPVTDEAVEPTDRIPGLTEGSHCDICGEVFVPQEIIPATFTVEGDVLVRYNGDAAIVIVPADLGVTTIGKHAFNATKVVEVVLPEGVTAIEEGAFSCCYWLEYVHLPSTLRTIGESAFNDSRKLKKVIIPEGITEIPELAFYSCYALAEVQLPSTLTTIDLWAFGHCYALLEIVIPDSVTSIDDYAFENTDPSLTIVSSYDAYARTWAERNNFAWRHDVHTEVIDEGYDATCTTDGLTEGKHCEVCGGIIVAQEIIPANGHNTVIDEAVPPACEETGLTEGSHCDVCGEIFVAQESINAIGHDWQDGDILVEPTCTSTGLRELICANDPSHISDRVILTVPHTEVIDPGVDATCLAPGLTVGSHCDVCGATLTEQVEIPIIPHREDIMFVAPTCTEPGEGGTYCLDCGTFTWGPEPIPPLGHGYNITNRVEPTCTEEGFCTYVCNEWNGQGYGCGDTYTDVIPANGHTVVIDAAVPPTCTEDGLTEGSHCDVCGEILIPQSVAFATGHTEVIDAAVEVTCITDGLTEGKHCDVCGEILIAQEVIPAGHNEVINVITDPTCTEAGMAARACDRCYEVFEYIDIPAGHIEVTVPQVDPTCTLIGLTAKIYCGRCGEVFQDHQAIPAIPHTEVIDYGYPATDSTNGLTEGSHCGVCGNILVPQEVIPARFTVENGVLVGARVDGPELVIPITLRITKIGSMVFYANDVLTSVVIPEGVTEIGNHAFYGCTKLENVQLPSTLKYVGNAAFFGCEKISEFILPEGLTEVGENSFAACFGLEKIHLPSTLHTIGAEAFHDSLALKEVTIPEGVTRLEPRTFAACGLEKVVFPTTLESIGDEVFLACHRLVEITIPASVTTVGENPFSTSTRITCDLATQGAMLEEACTNDYFGYFMIDRAHPDYLLDLDLDYTPARLTIYNYLGSDTKIALPAEIGGYTVTAASLGWSNFEEVYVPDTYLGLNGEGDDELVIVSSWDAPARTWAEEKGIAWRHDVHTEEILPAVEATQETNGLTEGVRCGECGEIIVAQEVIPAGKHKVVIQEGIAPTCTTDGLTEGSYCSKCGEVFKTQEIIPASDAHHAWINGTLTAAPDNAGSEMTYTCSRCGAVKTKPVSSGVAGDANEDGFVDMLDVIDMMEWYCEGAVELNLINSEVTGDGVVDMLDILNVLAWHCGFDVELK